MGEVTRVRAPLATRSFIEARNLRVRENLLSKRRGLSIALEDTPDLRTFLSIILTLLIVYVIINLTGTSVAVWVANATLPAAMGVACVLCVGKLVKRSRYWLLSPVPWFLLASALYYGLGPLMHIYGASGSISYGNKFYPVTQNSLIRTNILNAIGVFTVIGVFWLLRRFKVLARPLYALRIQDIDERSWLNIFIIIGLSVKVLVYLPYAYGVLPFVPPASIMVYGYFSSAAMLILSWNFFAGNRRVLTLLVALAGFELVGALLTFSKLEALQVVLFFGIGAYLGKPSKKVAVAAGVMLVLGYVVLIPLVKAGRHAVGASASMSERSSATQSYLGEASEGEQDHNDGIQTWWVRLCYANVQAFIMDAHDAGMPGTSLGDLPAMLVPRFLWPDKPIVTKGDQLTYLINGSSTSMSSPTSIGEGYWNYGWLGAIAVACWVGFVFHIIQTLCEGQFEKGIFGATPFALLGLMLGIRTDDWFGPAYFGGFFILLSVYATCLVLALAQQGHRVKR
jgi:hypothetical protein